MSNLNSFNFLLLDKHRDVDLCAVKWLTSIKSGVVLAKHSSLLSNVSRMKLEMTSCALRRYDINSVFCGIALFFLNYTKSTDVCSGEMREMCPQYLRGILIQKFTLC